MGHEALVVIDVDSQFDKDWGQKFLHAVRKRLDLERTATPRTHISFVFYDRCNTVQYQYFYPKYLSYYCIGCEGFRIEGEIKNIMPSLFHHQHKGRFEQVFLKTQANAFINPEFLWWLKKNEVKKISLVGYNTHACVKTTAKSAVAHGFQVRIFQDCVYPEFVSEKDKSDWLKDVTKNMIGSFTPSVEIV